MQQGQIIEESLIIHEDKILLTEEQAANFLHIAFIQFKALLKKGEIPYTVKGVRCYFSKQDLSAWRNIKEVPSE